MEHVDLNKAKLLQVIEQNIGEKLIVATNEDEYEGQLVMYNDKFCYLQYKNILKPVLLDHITRVRKTKWEVVSNAQQ